MSRRALFSAVTPRGLRSRILLEHVGRGRTLRTVNLGLISPDAFSPPYPLLFEATMPRLNARSDARDGDATSSDIRTRHPALETRVSASACTHLRGNAMRWGSAIRICQNFLVRRIRGGLNGGTPRQWLLFLARVSLPSPGHTPRRGHGRDVVAPGKRQPGERRE